MDNRIFVPQGIYSGRNFVCVSRVIWAPSISLLSSNDNSRYPLPLLWNLFGRVKTSCIRCIWAILSWKERFVEREIRITFFHPFSSLIGLFLRFSKWLFFEFSTTSYFCLIIVRKLLTLLFDPFEIFRNDRIVLSIMYIVQQIGKKKISDNREKYILSNRWNINYTERRTFQESNRRIEEIVVNYL